MRSILPATAAIMLFVPFASADPIEDREAIMKERSQILRTLGPIAQGRTPFDADTVLAALEELNANAQAHDIEALYPEGSEGGDATAAVWSDREGFIELDAEYRAAVQAAVAAAPEDQQVFRASFQPIGASCGTCHETYRAD
ncbi:cytochrome c [Aliihoeflea aestuarii]|uniref:c-type cytochrome n=1 Tax=Aliihoeflea aestuarii TaxID=453840 RepID=UPI002093E233|nr:cytochrome c [Aliihoeflea aestuarii]MCO6389535.1 cytochrome c [Aliihoeflea aestuarii]